MTEEKRNNSTDIRSQLVKKMSREFDNFVIELYFKDADTVLKRAYEYVIKRDLLLAIRDDYGNLGADELHFLCNQREPLESLYKRWCKREVTYMDRIVETVDNYCSSGVEVYKNGRK